MKDLKDIKQLTTNCRLKYVGFLLLSETVFGGNGIFERVSENSEETIEIQEAKELGKQYLFFKDTKGNFFWILNLDLDGANLDTPFGTFQRNVGAFNSNFDIAIEDGKYSVLTSPVIM